MLKVLTSIDDFMYYPLLIIIMIAAGLYFTIRTHFVQIRLLKESIHLIFEKPEDDKNVSSFQALMVSTASRVGTGNIIGVANAICLGGPGAVFWMWLICIIGASSAFTESTLAQIFKQRDPEGHAYGGPAYYIEKVVHSRWLSILFCISLLAAYGFGFNLLCSYNTQAAFKVYGFYNETWTPLLVGGVLAGLTAWSVFGGGKRVLKLTEKLVPFMGIFYVVISLIVLVVHIGNIPAMFVTIFKNAFDFKAIFGGVSGSCMIYGIKRGLYSNEAGVGSAPNASASAHVTHPAKQGLVQTISVYIDTMLLCTATALMCLSSGVDIPADTSGASYVQNAISTVFGSVGPIFITIALCMFAFTTLIGNLYYTGNALAYIHGNKQPSKRFMTIFNICAVVVIFLGAIATMDAAWAIADIGMGLMTIINLPCCVVLSKYSIGALRNFEQQLKEGKNPVFKASDVGIPDSEWNFWR